MLRITRETGGGDQSRRHRFGHRIICVAKPHVLGFEIRIGVVVADLRTETVERLGQEAEARRGGEFKAVDARFVGAIARLRHRDGHGLSVDDELLVEHHRLEAAVELLVIDGRRQEAVLVRSDEHTSELQSLMRISYAVFCLKKKHRKTDNTQTQIYTYT